MSKFNKSQNISKFKHNSTNVAGGKSCERDFKNEVAMLVLNSLLMGDEYYEKEKDKIERVLKYIKENLNDENSEFLAKALVYGRTKGYLRSISHILAFLLVENVKGKNFVRKAIRKAIVRPDDMTEIVALWDTKHSGTMIPNSLRRAMKDALEDGRFDVYQFRKYAQPKSKIKLKDIVKLTHPNPKNYEDKEIFKKIIEDDLPKIETAQTINTEYSEEERQKKYIEMIKERKLGYMALLKNLNKIFKHPLKDEEKQIVLEAIQDENLIRKSKILPFRLVQAYNAVKKMDIDEFLKKDLKKAIEKAIEISIKNTDLFVDENEKVAILLDDSASMTWGNRGKEPFMLGKILLGMILKKVKNRDNVITYFWSDRCKRVELENDSVLDIIDRYKAGGGGTLISEPLKELLKTKTKVDKIIILTDMQMYDDYWGEDIGKVIDEYIEKYKREVNPNVKVLFWNLASYEGGTPFDNKRDILELNGFSDKIFEILPKIWNDKDYLIKEIEKTEL